MPLEKNDQNGVNDTDKDALERAKHADLVTLPEDVKGTNCYNCKWISSDKKAYGSMCKHPKVKQYVNARMCCALWANKGMYQPFKRGKDFE
jgi:hypothetical protein